jgi:ankyrin repeat protein
MSSRLPSRPNLTYLRRQGKKLLYAVLNGEPEALSRVQIYLPKQRSGKLESNGTFGLRDALLVIAREYGFASWSRLKDHIARANRATTEDAEITESDLNTALFGCCENLNLERMKALLAEGADPNRAVNDGWDCGVLIGCLQTYTRREPDHLHTCVNTLIDAGASFEEGILWDLWRGRALEFEEQIRLDADLLTMRFQVDVGDHLTLRGSTLLHIAVEYGQTWAVDILLENGADLNARVDIGPNGVGGQTPLFHSIGTNQGSGYSMFEFLLKKEPDLTVKARIQEDSANDGKVMDCVHKGEDHFFDEVVELTPLGYAIKYEDEPDWRSASREAVTCPHLCIHTQCIHTQS